MTNKEFKAWFEGFTETLSGTPTKAQWARIKERVAEIDGNPVTERIYVDRYYWPSVKRQEWTYLSTGGLSGGTTAGLTNHNIQLCNSAVAFSSTDAMYAAGKAEALS